MNKFQKLILFLDLFLIAIMAFYGYMLYDMFSVSGKPIGVYVGCMVFTIVVYNLLRYQECFRGHLWFRIFGEPCCRPYLWIGENCRNLWNCIPWGRSSLKLRDPYLYNQFYYLPVLCINTFLYGCILCMNWTTLGTVFYNLLCLFFVFVTISVISFSALEIVYRLTAFVMRRIIKK